MMNFLLALSSGLLLWLGFAFPPLWWLTLFGLVPLLVALNRVGRPRPAFWLAGLVGLIYFGGVLWWYWSVLPLDWAGVTNPTVGFFLVGVNWIIPTLSGGLFLAAWGLTYTWLRRRAWTDALLAASLWMAQDFLRAWFVSLVWAGPGNLIGPHWTNGHLGYALAASPVLAPLAGLGGVYLLSGLCVMINGWGALILVKLYQRRVHWPEMVLAGSTLLVGSLLLITAQLTPAQTSTTVRAAVLNTYHPSFSKLTPEQFAYNLEKKRALFSRVKTDGQTPELVVLPEDSRLLLDLELTNRQQFIRDMVEGRETLIVDSARVADSAGAPHLAFFYLNTATGQAARTEKVFLAPNGEYLPYLTKWAASLLGKNEWIEGFAKARGTVPGATGRAAEFRNYKVGALACSEVLAPGLFRQATQQGAGVLINAASHALFNGSPQLYEQARNMARVRAAENNRYVLHAGNAVPSFVSDNRGRLVAETPWGKDTILYADVPIITSPSFYNSIGRWVMLVLVVGVIGWGITRKQYNNVT